MKQYLIELDSVWISLPKIISELVDVDAQLKDIHILYSIENILNTLTSSVGISAFEFISSQVE